MNLLETYQGKHYVIIYADPPWAYNDKGFGKRPTDITIKGSFAPEAGRYSTMSLSEIKALPVKNIAAPDSALLLWATSPLLPEALETIQAWGVAAKIKHKRKSYGRHMVVKCMESGT